MKQAELKSPRISHLSWGHIEVAGRPPFKDAKVFPGGAREWDWREMDTHHVPGIQPADVQELIERGAEAVVLSKGIWERLNVCPETLKGKKPGHRPGSPISLVPPNLMTPSCGFEKGKSRTLFSSWDKKGRMLLKRH